MDANDFNKIHGLHSDVKTVILADNQVVMSESGDQELVVIDSTNHIMHVITPDTRATQRVKTGIAVRSFPIDVVQYITGYYDPEKFVAFLAKLKADNVIDAAKVAAIKAVYGIV